MDFNLSEEQNILKKTAREFLETHCNSDFVRSMEEDEKGYSDELWKKISELGWIGLMLPEEYGGIEWGLLDLVLMLEEMGRFCFPGPYLSTVLCSQAICQGGSESLKAELLPRVAQGDVLMSLAYLEPGSTRFEPAYVELKAQKSGEGYQLKGTKLFVEYAHVAGYFVVTARSHGQALSREGISLFLVPAASAGISLTPLRNIAGDKLFEVVFQGVEVDSVNLLGAPGQGWPLLDRIVKMGALGKCAEMVGGASRVCEMTVEYAKERVQFGQVIGKFQAVQHHCANMLMDLEGSRYITYKAAWMMDQGLECDLMVAAAKAWCSEAYRRVVGVGHQIGAGTAYMVEHDMPLYSRRAKAAELAFGDAAYHCEQAAQALGL